MAEFSIILGNKNYSSWSFRGWLALKLCGVDFAEEVIPLIKQILREPVFASGEVDTRWLEREMDNILPRVV